MKKLFLFTVLSLFLQLSVMNVCADEPSKWAKAEINEAIESGLVPKELQNSYTNNITREEFCKLCTAVMKAWDSGSNYNEGTISFSDTDDKDVLVCAGLGIVSGIGDNKFAPDNPIKRQEAARMLYNTLNTATPVIMESHGRMPLGFASCCVPHSFDDGGLIRAWARDEINHMYRFGVMLGVSNNNYNPDGYYTREQAICTFLRLYNCYGSMENNPIQKDYFPNRQSCGNYISDGVSYAIGYDKESFSAQYIDNEGNLYTQADKGYVYPFDRSFAAIVTNLGAGVATESVIDRDGNLCFEENSVFESVEVTSSSVVCVEKDTYNTKIYSLPDKKLVFDGIGHAVPMGDGLYLYHGDGENAKVINTDGKIIVPSSMGFESTDSKSFNDLFVLKKESGECSVFNKNGEKLKTFKADSSWEYNASVGTNIVFKDEKNDEYVLYRAMSGKAQRYKTYITLMDNNEVIACGDNYHYYILNSDGSVKLDAGSLGYKNVIKTDGFDFYRLLKDNGESGLFDLADKNGRVIKTDVKPSLVFDKGGFCAYVDESKISFFDFFGDDIGEFDLSAAYGEESNEWVIKHIKFINGLLWVDTEASQGQNSESFYVIPNGQIINIG